MELLFITFTNQPEYMLSLIVLVLRLNWSLSRETQAARNTVIRLAILSFLTGIYS